MAATPLFKLETEQISEETKHIAVVELRETEDIVTQSYEELRALLAIDSSLFYHTDDEFLRIFLRPCKYYAKSAYSLMKRVANYKEKYSNLCGNILPIMMKEIIITNNIFNVLINRDQKGRRIVICHSKNWDPSVVTSDQLLQLLYLLHLTALLEPETQVRGIVIIVDCEGVCMKHIKGFTPSFAVKLLTFMQYAMPLRLKELHIINQPFIFNIVWTIIKPLLVQKAKRRLILHGKDITNLHKYLLPCHLPEDFGGDLPKIWYTGKDWYPEIEEQTEFIRKWNSCGRRVA